MSEAAPTWEEFWKRVGEDLGYNIKWETKGEEKAKREVAKNALAEGFPVEDVVKITGFSLETVQELAEQP
jgi:hypothetical protein